MEEQQRTRKLHKQRTKYLAKISENIQRNKIIRKGYQKAQRKSYQKTLQKGKHKKLTGKIHEFRQNFVKSVKNLN